ncbi:MAG: right-handed parallel beta-helix repeat-containing protein [Oricola sp.]
MIDRLTRPGRHLHGFFALSGLLAAAMALSGAPAFAGTVRNATTSAEYASLAEAVAAASPGDTLTLESGSYEGALVIDKPLTFSGSDTGEGRPVIDGGGAPVAILLAASGITIEGVEVTSANSPARPWGIFSAYAEEACILARGTAGHVIRDSAINGCHYGVYLLESHDTAIENSVITGNRFGGVFIRNSHGDRVVSNRIESNGYEGIGVGTVTFPPAAEKAFRQLAGSWWTITTDTRPDTELMSHDVEIASNTVTGHDHGGISVGFAREIRIVSNTVTGNGGAPVPKSFPEVSLSPSPRVRGYGIALKCNSHENEVAGNDVRDNANTGILLDRSYANSVDRNEVSGSEIGLLGIGSHGNTVENNVIAGNSGYGILIERGAPMLPPSVANLVVRNDIVDNGVNAFDTSGKDTAAAKGPVADQGPAGAYMPKDLKAVNRWDDGSEGNHHSDFDEAPEEFADTDGNGIGETAHPIPGGLAVDHFPLAAPPAE